jgi:hypothetical protein
LNFAELLYSEVGFCFDTASAITCRSRYSNFRREAATGRPQITVGCQRAARGTT